MPVTQNFIKRERNLLDRIGTIDTGYIPHISTTTGQNGIVAGIAGDELGLVLRSR